VSDSGKVCGVNKHVEQKWYSKIYM
jgi:hypothetical protein